MNNLMNIALSPFLTNSKVLELIKLYRETKKEDYLNLIVRNYIKLILRKAHKYKRQEVDVGDLIHYGMDGLIDAIRWSYNLSKKEKFITYITIIIERRMKDGLDIQKTPVMLPKNIMTQQRKIRHKKVIIEPSDNSKSSEIIYSKLNISDFREFEVSILNKDPNYQKNLMEKLLDDESLQFDIHRILNVLLTKTEKSILIHSFGLNGESPKAFDAIGLLLNISAQKIRKLHSATIRKIKSSSKSTSILKKYIM